MRNKVQIIEKNEIYREQQTKIKTYKEQADKL